MILARNLKSAQPDARHIAVQGTIEAKPRCAHFDFVEIAFVLHKLYKTQ